jgi:hypothetical protein
MLRTPQKVSTTGTLGLDENIHGINPQLSPSTDKQTSEAGESPRNDEESSTIAEERRIQNKIMQEWYGNDGIEQFRTSTNTVSG